jgi:DNA recombination protein RmuC
MSNAILAALFILNLAVLVLLVVLLQRLASAQGAGNSLAQLVTRLDGLERTLSQLFSTSATDMASRLEQTKGDLRQQVTDRLSQGFQEMRASVEQHLAAGRREQTEGLGGARKELTDSLALTTRELKIELESLSQKTAQSMEAIRAQVDQKLLTISEQVQQKLNENIKEGFAQFEKVQQHLKAAEEQLRQLGTIGDSINDLNNLLKLPHLRGRFGEASLERLLADFLPANMYEIQASPSGEDRSRADAIINFPDRRLPIDAKFPREQVLPLFESSDQAQLTEARQELARVLKTEAKRIHAYIQPEHGTMDIALMYLPSETLYLEAIRSEEAMDALGKLQVFPVSPNTLLMTLKTVSLAYRWYEVAARFEETRKELAKAQVSLGHFQKQFETIGKKLDDAQEAFGKASTHFKQYRGRVASLTGEEGAQLELPAGSADKTDAAGK